MFGARSMAVHFALIALTTVVGLFAIFFYWERIVRYVEINDKFFVAGGTIVIAFFTVVLALATALLFLSSEKVAEAAKESAEATQKAVELSDRTAERQLRAYIGIKPTILHNLRPTHATAIAFNVINFGQTPAYNLRQAALAFIVPFPLPKNFPFPSLEAIAPVQNTLNPQDSVEGLAGLESGKPFTVSEIEEIVEGSSKRLTVFGIVKYRDAFKHERTIKFCFSLAGTPNRVVNVRAGDWASLSNRPVRFEFCPQHNESEQD